jgi:Lhr-like helicase
MDIHEDLADGIQKAIFGEKKGHLYAHQDTAIREILRSVRQDCEKDTVITVPTATGKTESFLIPAIETALKNKSESEYPINIKSLIIYPQKALETDQLNRLVEYSYFINQSRDTFDQLTVGIYDGDTPRGAYKMYDGQSVRGLQCPLCGTKLEWDDNTETVLCRQLENHPNNKPVEIDYLEVVRNKIESDGVDILITNPEAYEFRLFSSENRSLVDSDVLDTVIFDEAHVWNGNGGTAVSHFIERLRARYDPTMVLASATIANPKEFASQLLRRDQLSINHIQFEPESKANKPPQVTDLSGEIVPPNEALPVLTDIVQGSGATDSENAIDWLKQIGLLESSSSPSELGEELGSALASDPPVDSSSFQSLFNDNRHLREQLSDRLFTTVPEIYTIFNEFEDDDFVPVEELTEALFPDNSAEGRFELLTALLNWCKLAGILYDRYHFFIRPFEGFYYCSRCGSMHSSRQEVCKDRSHPFYPVFPCSTCHSLYYQTDNGDYYPIGEGCSCVAEHRLSEQHMQASTFLSYFLTRLGRDLKEFGQGKVLAFSNRRADAEGIGELMMTLDYTIEAEREMLSLLQEHRDEVYTISELEEDLQNELRDTFISEPYGYLDDEILYEGLSRRIGRVANPLNKDDHRKLYEAGLLSLPQVDEEDPELSFLANEIFKILSFKPHTDLDLRYSVRKDGLKRKLSNSVDEYLKFAPDLTAKIDAAISQLDQQSIIRKDRIREDESVTEILVLRPEFTVLEPQPEALFCPHCYSGWPFWDREFCPDCGEDLVDTNREQNNPTETDDFQHEPLYEIDHWGKLIYQKNPDPLVTAVHKAGISPDTRNKIEEAFSASPPRINIVSATTTLELGIDIGTLDCIIDLGIPPTQASYTQRAGRAGRDLDRSSVVFTIANPHSSVDTYYFEDIESRFLNAEPKPTNINTLGNDIFKTQLLSEIISYLNQHQLDYVEFERFDTNAPLETVLSSVYEGIQQMEETIDSHRDNILEHLDATFDSQPRAEIETAMQEIFGDSGLLKQRALRRLFKFYSLYTQLSEAGDSVHEMRRRRIIQEELSEELSREIGNLPFLLSKSGLVAQFRSAGDNTVLFRTKNSTEGTETLEYESKSIAQALRESYPGAVDTYGGTPYEVVNTQVSKDPVFQANICQNSDCLLEMKQQPAELDHCALCGDALFEAPIHEYLGSLLEPASGNRSTRPLNVEGIDFD